MTLIDLAALLRPTTPLLLEIDTGRQASEEPNGNKLDDDRFLSLVNKFVVTPVWALADQPDDNQTIGLQNLFISLVSDPGCLPTHTQDARNMSHCTYRNPKRHWISQSRPKLSVSPCGGSFSFLAMPADSQLSGLDFDQLDDVANGVCMPRPSTWPTTHPSGRPVTPPRIDSLETGKSSEATPSLSGSPVKSVSKKSPPPARPDRLQATVSANAADKVGNKQRDSRAAVTLRSMPSRESISDYTNRVRSHFVMSVSVHIYTSIGPSSGG